MVLDWDNCTSQVVDLVKGVESNRDIILNRVIELADGCMHCANDRNNFVDSSISNDVIDIIVAADVMYDRGATLSLFSTIRSLGTPNHTVVYLAQKSRNNNASVKSCVMPNETTFYSASDKILIVQGFRVDLVYDEANVLIWKLMLL